LAQAIRCRHRPHLAGDAAFGLAKIAPAVTHRVNMRRFLPCHAADRLPDAARLCMTDPAWDNLPSRRSIGMEANMRFLLGVIVGAALLAGVAYVHDTVVAAPGSANKFVNWSLVKSKIPK
jgi:hypothetical protein